MQPTKSRADAVQVENPLHFAFRISAFTALLLALIVTSGVAGPQRQTRASLDEFEKIDVEDLAEEYQEFFDEVKIIMTPEEEEVFLRLESDFQRDEFMVRFWRARDPSPGTPKNEYQEEFQRRLEHVEKHYGRDTPRQGRDTDRGRMYLLLGEPMNVKTFPWTQEAYPAEIWWYHANPKLGIPPYFYLAFFKRNGVGEFRLYSPLVDGPTALLNPAGMEHMRRLQTGEEGEMAQMDGEIGAAYDVLLGVDAELAQVSLSLIPGDYGGQAGYGSMRSQMMMGDIESIPEAIMPTASWSYPILTGVVEADVRFESLPIRANAIALLDPSGIPFVHYGLMTEGSRLNLNNYEDNWYVTFEVAGTLVDEQNRIITSVKGADETSSLILQADLDEQAVRRLRSGPLLYMNRIPAIPGAYDFELVLENNVSREYGRQAFSLDVPRPWPTVLRSSSPLLAWAVFDTPEYDAYGPHYPFQVGPYNLIPALDPVFSVADGIFVFQQIYLPRDHQGRLTAYYRLSNDGGTVLERTEYIEPEQADDNGTIHHITRLELEGIAPGDYEVFVDIEGDDRGGITTNVTVEDVDDDRPTPHLHMNTGPPPTDPFLAYDRALQYRTVGRVEDAIETLSSAVERVEDDEILALQIDLLMEAGRYEEVGALLQPMQIEKPNDTKILMALAAVSAQMGRDADAIRYYERIRLVTTEEDIDVLNPLASAYFGEGRLNKAREILELSLQVKPDQPEIRRLLNEVLGKGQG